MKMSKSAQLLTGLGLAAGLFWGCQDLLSQKDDPSSGTPVTADETVLSLSIKDDPACREQWNSILAARTNGHPDSMAESAFLSGCVKEIKAGKDKIPPIIPPGLVPDSLSRCHWIVAQIEGGRNEMTVSYKRYCPNDCRKLEDKDSVRHEHLCRDSGVDTTKPPRDTVKVPRDTIEKPPHPNTSECAAIKLKLSMAKPGEPGRADLERMFKMHCLDSIPPKPTDPNEDTCKMILARLASKDLSAEEYLEWKHIYQERCEGGKPPIDTVKPPIDTVKPPHQDTSECAPIKGDYIKRCTPHDTIVVKPIPKNS